jgi:hypothetical protein
MAADREVAGQSLADVVARLRCQRCAQRPFGVALEEDAAAGCWADWVQPATGWC